MSGETVEQSEFSHTSGETFKLVQLLLHSGSATRLPDKPVSQVTRC